jgi:glycerophosphoryl diester phosphodiesterase
VRQQPPGRDFLIIGHRGAPHQACENTLESFETALQLGANALELDMSMTSDQHVVLWHDWVMSIKSELRPTGVCRVLRPPLGQSIYEVPLHELVRDYGYEQAGQRVPILTFTEFVQRLGQDDRARLFFLDLKIPEERPDLVPPLFQHAVQTLQQYHTLDKAVFLTPYETVFHQLRHEAQRWYQTTHARVAIAFDTEGPALIQLCAWPSAVRRNQRAGTRPPQARMRFIVWTVNDSSDLCALVGAGVDGIMTDDPGHLRAIVQHWGQPGNCPLLHSESTSSQAGTAGALP